MSAALHAEWTKLRTTWAPFAVLLGVVAVTAGGSAIACASPPAPGADLGRLELTGVQFGQVLVAVLAVLVMGDEHRSGLVRVSLAAVPRRNRLLAAKAGVLTLTVAVTAIPAVGLAALAGHALLARPVALTRPVTGSILDLVLVALLSLGVSTVIRNQGAATGTLLALLVVVPLLVEGLTDPTWRRHLEQLTPTAGLAVQASAPTFIGPWKGLGVLALWALTSVVVAARVFRRRDYGEAGG